MISVPIHCRVLNAMPASYKNVITMHTEGVEHLCGFYIVNLVFPFRYEKRALASYRIITYLYCLLSSSMTICEKRLSLFCFSRRIMENEHEYNKHECVKG